MNSKTENEDIESENTKQIPMFSKACLMLFCTGLLFPGMYQTMDFPRFHYIVGESVQYFKTTNKLPMTKCDDKLSRMSQYVDSKDLVHSD